MPRTLAGGPARSLVRRALDTPGDRVALAVLAAAPILLYVPIWLAGRPIVPGDDLTQNLPLRVLVGEVLRSGHLPGWNPFIWSGTPLLAGWNAGALFPGTWLFVVLPAVAAWTANLVLTGVFAGVGMHALARRLRCGPLASCLAGLAFADTGFMNGQVVHIGLVEGTALTPWMLLAVEVLARPDRLTARARVATAGLLAVAGALVVLAGDPRAVTTAVIATGVYSLGWCWRAPRQTRQLLGTLAAATVLAALLSAVQWLPGLGFVHVSQRGQSAYSFFGGGSLHLGEVATLLTVPFVLGTNGNLGQPFYAGNYNLPEVTIGVGLLALVAACAFLPGLAVSALRRVRDHAPGAWRRASTGGAGSDGPSHATASSPARRPLGVWYVLVVVGVLLTLGSNTPLGHVLVEIPLYNGQRLQNRNIALVDIALVVLLAFFLDDLLRHPSDRCAPARTGRAARPLDDRVSRAAALVPVTWLVAVVAWAWAAPVPLERFVGVVEPTPGLMAALTPYLVTTLVLGLAAGTLVVCWGRARQRARTIALVTLALCDIAMYVVNSGFATVPASLLGSSTSASAPLARLVGRNGRFALYDPSDATVPGPSAAELDAIGVPDLNVLRHLPSVQGYGSIVDGAYDAATGTHAVAGLDAGELAGPTFDSLDLRALLLPPGFLVQAIPPDGSVSVPGGPTVTALGAPAATSSHTVRATGERELGPRASSTWLLADRSRLVRVTVVVVGRDPTAASLAVSVGGDHGAAHQARVVAMHDGVASFVVPGAPRSALVHVENRAGIAVRVGAVVATSGEPGTAVVLDGALQRDLSPPRWSLSGTIDGLTAFTSTAARGLAWLEPATSTSPDARRLVGSAVSTGAALETGSQTMHVTATNPALLVRSEAYSPGWTARIAPRGGGPVIVEPVRPLGLIQAVRIPAGTYTVTWRYAPAEILEGLVASGAGLVLLAGALVWCTSGRRRR